MFQYVSKCRCLVREHKGYFIFPTAEPYKDGVKINSPHYLCKLEEVGSQVFTLVISQYEKTNTIHYTLRVFSQCDINFTKITDPYKHEKTVSTHV